MSPPNPKRPPRSPGPPGDPASRQDAEVELPFDDDEVAPLQADDPRPQRVPQYPAGARRRRRRGPGGLSREARDREMPARFDSGEYEDPGHAPAFLYVERGPGAGQLIPVKQGVLVLGRASTSDLRLQHPSISRRHAQLTRRGDALSLKDLGSQNGTYVNRDRLTAEVELHPGDEIALGNALLRLRGPGPTPERPRASLHRPTSSLRVGMSSRRLVLLAAATGSLVAVFLTLAAVRLVRSRGETAGPEALVEPGYPAEVPVAGTSEASRAAPAEVSSFTEEPLVAEQAPAPERPGGKVRGAAGTRALSAQALAETSKGAGSKQREVGARAKAGTGKVVSKPPPTEPRSAQDSADEAEAEARSRYEAGNVEAALSLARRAHLDALASTLSRFQAEWIAGNAALAAHDPSSALQHFSTARELDQELANGWGTYAPLIRKALAQAQMQESKQGNER
ncbi:FHA domain-containing protein [Archangium violaceum]|uniref:FHA domain-containing protein n=1 Tax=Archangium violaceum TaxID=83451 RepID=UPI001951FD5F|nr:FHA domain-containing protein [Archangium violaceum]QRN94308.1 FHA domain-containing protein [Archangium violaceum]